MKYILSLTILSMMACFGSEKTEDTSEQENSTNTSASNFAPQTGTWSVSASEMLSDDCYLYDGAERDTMDISLNTDGSYSTTMGSGDVALTFDCSLSGYDFSCTVEEEDIVTDNAIQIHTYSFNGPFSSTTEFSAETSLTISCEGSECETYGLDSSCVFAGTMTASYAN